MIRAIRGVFWNEDDQKIRWSRTTTFDGGVNYSYIGQMSEPEFELLLEVLWYLYEDGHITHEDFVYVFSDIREFCDRVKKLINE